MTATMPTRAPFRGTKRGLLLAFDIGTTFSGVSYSVLDPGQVPQIQGVMRFPGQEATNASSKIPTIIYYDQSGKVRAVGAEAMDTSIAEMALGEDWAKAEWFKFHMRPNSQSTPEITSKIPPLPLKKSVVAVVADFLKYLYKCTKHYIRQSYGADGQSVWHSFGDRIYFVLPHPNGWEGAQQSHMRKAAVLAGLIPDSDSGHSRISFVTEGEASLHFAIQNGFSGDALRSGEGVLIVDAGGGTIDMSAYRQTDRSKASLSEIALPQCYFYGSVYVTIAARQFLETHLAESNYIDDIDGIVDSFDRTTKLRFKDTQTPTQFIKFGSARDNDDTFGIRFGQLKLSSEQVSKFFEPSVTCIVNAIRQQYAATKFSHVIMVGGFSSSDWLISRITELLYLLGMKVLRPDNYVNKAVADGAVSFYLDHYVNVRIARAHYGCIAYTNYNEQDPAHLNRKEKAFYHQDGRLRLHDHFSNMLRKNSRVSETFEVRKTLSCTRMTREKYNRVTESIWCYRGNKANPSWLDDDPDNFQVLCSINFDLSGALNDPKTQKQGPGGVYYDVPFEVILFFGLTEFKAQIAWVENGQEKRTPATIVYAVGESEDEKAPHQTFGNYAPERFDHNQRPALTPRPVVGSLPSWYAQSEHSDSSQLGQMPSVLLPPIGWPDSDDEVAARDLAFSRPLEDKSHSTRRRHQKSDESRGSLRSVSRRIGERDTPPYLQAPYSIGGHERGV